MDSLTKNLSVCRNKLRIGAPDDRRQTRVPSDYTAGPLLLQSPTGCFTVKFQLQPAAEGARIEGEQKANMTGRPDFSPDKPLSAEELAEVRRRYAQLSTPSLQTTYSEAWERCKLDKRGRAPHSVHIQVLVQAWKALRKAR